MMNTAYKRVMVGLDLTEFDDGLLTYVKHTSALFRTEQAHFVHVSPGLEIPAYLENTFDLDGELPLDEKLKATMVNEVMSLIQDTPFNMEFDVLEGNVTRQILHWVKVKRADLAYIGRKDARESSGLAAKRFVRHASCDVMLVPEGAPEAIGRIVVCTDFSENSDWAFRKALDLARRLPNPAEILLLHIFEVPPTWHNQVGRTQAQFEALVRANLEDYLEKYLGEIDTQGIQVTPILIELNDTPLAQEIAVFAQNAEADLLIMGAKGHTDLDAFLLGSVTEKVLNLEENVPLLVVKTPWRQNQSLLANEEKQRA